MNPDFNIISEELLIVFLKLLFNPLYPLSIILIAFVYWRQMRLERTYFSVRFRSPWKETGKAVLWGWVVGISVSLVMLLWGMSITFEAMLTIWAATVLFWLFRTR